MPIPIDPYLTEVLMRDLVGHDRKPAAFLIYLWFSTQPAARRELQISYFDLAESTGLSKSSAQAAILWLLQRKLLAVRRDNATAVPRYTVLTPWKKTKGAP
jgi:hypothetical protein